MEAVAQSVPERPLPTPAHPWPPCARPGGQVEKAGLTVGVRAVADKSYDVDELEVGGGGRRKGVLPRLGPTGH